MRQFEGNTDTDPILVEYIGALQVGDIDKAVNLQTQYPERAERFETMKNYQRGLMALYIREIQILRLELNGWKQISEGSDDLLDGEPTANQRIDRGLKQVERAIQYRKTHSDIDLPKLKCKV